MQAELIDVMGDDLRVAYIAGLIDADGCLSINKTDEGRYAPSLSFVNTHLPLVELIQQRYGGHIQKKKKISNNHADVYELNIRDANELSVAVNSLIPFLIYKRKKAELVEEYALSIIKNQNKKLSEETKAVRSDIMLRWRGL